MTDSLHRINKVIILLTYINSWIFVLFSGIFWTRWQKNKSTTSASMLLKRNVHPLAIWKFFNLIDTITEMNIAKDNILYVNSTAVLLPDIVLVEWLIYNDNIHNLYFLKLYWELSKFLVIFFQQIKYGNLSNVVHKKIIV